MSQDCTCITCVSACHHKPGWFKPGQVELVAKHLKMPLKQLFKRYLGVDFWVGNKPIFVLAPATTTMKPGSEYPVNPRGKCIFLTKNDRCAIHPVKPHECREMLHNQSESVNKKVKKEIVERWRQEQPQIQEILGRAPVEPKGSVLDLF